MKQQNGKRKKAWTMLIVCVLGVSFVGYKGISGSTSRKDPAPSSHRVYVQGLVENKPAGFWVNANAVDKVESEMLLFKEKIGTDSFGLRLTSPKHANLLFCDSDVVDVKTVVGVVIAQ